MADFSQETINIGTTSNDGTGDTIRVSFHKTNNNFTELYYHAANASANIANLQTDLEQYAGDLLQLGGSAYDTANDAFAASNTLILISQTAIIIANNAGNVANGSAVNASAAFAYANSQYSTTILTRNHANSGYRVANAAFDLANTIADVNATAVEQSAKLNLAYTKANDAYDMAVATYEFAIGVDANTTASFGRANTIYGYLNAAFSKVNTVFNLTNTNFGVTNSAYTTTNAAYYTTNSSYRVANSAYNTANSKIDTVDGTATGSFVIQDGVTIATNHNINGFGATFRTGSSNYGLRIYPGGGSDTTASILRLTNSSYATLGLFTANNSEVTIGSNTNIPVIVKVNGSQMGKFDSTGLYVSGEIAGFYSDERLKDNVKSITNPIERIKQLKGVTYNANELAASFGFTDKSEQVGLLTQDLEKVLPQVVKPAPFDTAIDEKGKQYSISGENYKTAQYEKVVPLLVEVINILIDRVEELEGKK